MTRLDSAPFDDVRALIDKPAAFDNDSAQKVRDALAGMGRPGDFGRLGDAAAWLARWQQRYPPRIEMATLAVFAGSHGVRQLGASLSSDDDTRKHIDALRSGAAPLSAIAAQNETNIRVFELAIEKPTPVITHHDAMSERECAATIAYGFEALEGAPDVLALGVSGAGIGTVAAAVACALYGGAPDYWVRPTADVDEEATRGRVEIVRDALNFHRKHIDDPLQALRCLGGRELAACVGAIIAAREQGVPVILDGFATTIAAGIVHAINPSAVDHVMSAHSTQRPAHLAALERIGLKPLLDFSFKTGGGMGSTTAVGVLRTACAPFLGKPA